MDPQDKKEPQLSLQEYMAEMKEKVSNYVTASNSLSEFCSQKWEHVMRNIWAREYQIHLEELRHMEIRRKLESPSLNFTTRQKAEILKILNYSPRSMSSGPGEFVYRTTALKISPTVFGFQEETSDNLYQKKSTHKRSSTLFGLSAGNSKQLKQDNDTYDSLTPAKQQEEPKMTNHPIPSNSYTLNQSSFLISYQDPFTNQFVQSSVASAFPEGVCTDTSASSSLTVHAGFIPNSEANTSWDSSNTLMQLTSQQALIGGQNDSYQPNQITSQVNAWGNENLFEVASQEALRGNKDITIVPNPLFGQEKKDLTSLHPPAIDSEKTLAFEAHHHPPHHLSVGNSGVEEDQDELDEAIKTFENEILNMVTDIPGKENVTKTDILLQAMSAAIEEESTTLKLKTANSGPDKCSADLQFENAGDEQMLMDLVSPNDVLKHQACTLTTLTCAVKNMQNIPKLPHKDIRNNETSTAVDLNSESKRTPIIHRETQALSIRMDSTTGFNPVMEEDSASVTNLLVQAKPNSERGDISNQVGSNTFQNAPESSISVNSSGEKGHIKYVLVDVEEVTPVHEPQEYNDFVLDLEDNESLPAPPTPKKRKVALKK